MRIDDETCYRALVARDVRFDGLFFVGVTTTGIYCRPICPARTPRSDRCRFFPSAAMAESNGFRPCLRCRPELAPGEAPVDVVGRTARRAAARIEAGALNEDGSLETLARELGLSSRQLRRAVRQEFGVSPVELAQTRRLLLAKQLLTETRLPLIEVASASGFSSVRRFNALFRSHYGFAPSRLRKSAGAVQSPDCLRLTLSYRPPLAWDVLLRFLGGRGSAGVECVQDGTYLRTIRLGRHRGWIRVAPVAGRQSLAVEVSTSLTPVLPALLARIRGLFDLDARPDAIATQLARDEAMAQRLSTLPGLASPAGSTASSLRSGRSSVSGSRSPRRPRSRGVCLGPSASRSSRPTRRLRLVSPSAERLAETRGEALSAARSRPRPGLGRSSSWPAPWPMAGSTFPRARIRRRRSGG
ncbi:MAG: AlkA N-terminal domain-containing protein [Isosphaeraceae bacterium]